MNKICIIGNLCANPELRSTPNGVQVCSFTVAANRKKKVEGQPDADFFQVTAWRELGVNCSKYLAKGRKVCVIGSVSLYSYQGKDGQTKSFMRIIADEVEFLSPKQDGQPEQKPEPKPVQGGFTQVDDEELPF